MADLENARDKAEEVRYSDDKKNDILDSDFSEGDIEYWRNDFVRDCLRINPDVTPKLCSQIEIAVQRLGVPPSVIEGYVRSSPEINASCFYPTASHCFINLTSGLIELLDADELIFVIGHELGHFLLNHGVARHSSSDSTVEHIAASKRMEISADRVGMLACENLEKAVWAMMKSSTGLSESHLRFDVTQFTNQIAETEDTITLSGLRSTHPSVYVRIQALLWQNMKSARVYESSGGRQGKRIDIDGRIREILYKYEDGKVLRDLKKLRTEVAMYAIGIELIKDAMSSTPRVVNKDVLFEVVGESDGTSLLGYVGHNPSDRRLKDAFRRLNSAESRLEALSPEATKQVIDETVATAKQSLWS